MALPRFAAHRGGAALWPENTLAAFRGALALGLDLLELDVHPSADGEIVVIHDATLERMTEGAGPVRAQPAAALRRLRVRGRDGALTEERVPLLDDVLALAVGAGAELLLELKGPALNVRYGRGETGGIEVTPGSVYEGLEARVVACLDAAGMTRRTTIMAFNPAVIDTIRALAPSQPTTLLVRGDHVEQAAARAAEMVDWAGGLGVGGLGLQHLLIDAEVVARARANGLRLGAWTVNHEHEIHRLAALGVDIIITDRPDLVLRNRAPAP